MKRFLIVAAVLAISACGSDDPVALMPLTEFDISQYGDSAKITFAASVPFDSAALAIFMPGIGYQETDYARAGEPQEFRMRWADYITVGQEMSIAVRLHYNRKTYFWTKTFAPK